MSNDPVPIRRCPDTNKINALLQSFVKEFGKAAQFTVRVPGRVNLIGEHIDYCGFPVLPMALEQDVLVAVAVEGEESPMLDLRNLHSKYVKFNCVLSRPQHIYYDNSTNAKPHWYNYVLCGIKGAMEYLDCSTLRGIKMMVAGNIPPAAGLSSSSALVSASCLAFIHAHNDGAPIDKSTIAALCATSERHIGTQGGGMDQAIAFLAKRGAAQYITWNPLEATPIPLPEDAVFVVAHSMSEANKAATNDFNQRVVECRLAAAILAKFYEIKSKVRTLGDVRDTLKMSLVQMLELVNKHIPFDTYSKSDLCDLLELEEFDLNAKYLTKNTAQIENFKIRQRATHVLEEAIRVENFRAICLNETKSENNVQNGKRACIIKNLGELMRSSHTSLDDLYECSHPNLNRLVQLSDKAGVHARLTGAGWGGCIVALCSRSQLEPYLSLLKQEYYSQVENAHELFFATVPNDGAQIYVP